MPALSESWQVFLLWFSGVCADLLYTLPVSVLNLFWCYPGPVTLIHSFLCFIKHLLIFMRCVLANVRVSILRLINILSTEIQLLDSRVWQTSCFMRTVRKWFCLLIDIIRQPGRHSSRWNHLFCVDVCQKLTANVMPFLPVRANVHRGNGF